MVGSVMENVSSPTSLYSLIAFVSSNILKLTCLFLILFALFASISKNLFFLSWCSISGSTLSTSESNLDYLSISLSIKLWSTLKIGFPSFLRGYAMTLGAMNGYIWDASPNLIEWDPGWMIIVSAPFSDRFRNDSRVAGSCIPCNSNRGCKNACWFKAWSLAC